MSDFLIDKGRKRFGRWPLGLNAEMDRHAESLGLSHWSCVSPNTNEWWVRVDGFGKHVSLGSNETYSAALRRIDSCYPL